MYSFSKKCFLAILLTGFITTTGCTYNDLDKYRDNGLIPGEASTVAEVIQKASVAAKQRDEESIGNALDELADIIITTSPVWLPPIQSFINN